LKVTLIDSYISKFGPTNDTYLDKNLYLISLVNCQSLSFQHIVITMGYWDYNYKHQQHSFIILLKSQRNNSSNNNILLDTIPINHFNLLDLLYCFHYSLHLFHLTYFIKMDHTCDIIRFDLLIIILLLKVNNNRISMSYHLVYNY
jgi:hypothetical protein